MSYDDDMTWEALSGRCGAGVRDLIGGLKRGEAHYDKWQSVRVKDGVSRTNAQIATDLSRPAGHPKGELVVTETMIANMDAAYARMLHVEKFARNDPDTLAGDSYFAWVKFY